MENSFVSRKLVSWSTTLTVPSSARTVTSFLSKIAMSLFPVRLLSFVSHDRFHELTFFFSLFQMVNSSLMELTSATLLTFVTRLIFSFLAEVVPSRSTLPMSTNCGMLKVYQTSNTSSKGKFPSNMLSSLCRESKLTTISRLFTFSANLFVTQNARLQLERHGVVLYRDSSANKGGVTSSSMEVLAGMSLNDEQFLELMCSPPGEDSFSDFYLEYVKSIQQTSAYYLSPLLVTLSSLY